MRRIPRLLHAWHVHARGPRIDAEARIMPSGGGPQINGSWEHGEGSKVRKLEGEKVSTRSKG